MGSGFVSNTPRFIRNFFSVVAHWPGSIFVGMAATGHMQGVHRNTNDPNMIYCGHARDLQKVTPDSPYSPTFKPFLNFCCNLVWRNSKYCPPCPAGFQIYRSITQPSLHTNTKGTVMCSFLGNSPGVLVLIADVSEHSVGSIFIDMWMKYFNYILNTPAYEDGTDSGFRNVGN